MKTLIPILGDQLSHDLSSLDGADPANTVLLIAEVADETTYVRHHRRKLAYILSAMRHHAEAMRARGWTVDYIKLDDPESSGSFTGEVARAIGRHAIDRIVVTEAGEWRVQGMLEAWETLFGLPVEIRTDMRFIASHTEFEAFAEGRNDLVMEFFYREQRRKTGLLMNGTKPEGGRWNFDKENRKPATTDLFMPAQPRFPADAITQDVIAMVERDFPELIGDLTQWDLAVTHEDAIIAQAAFLDGALPSFGDYQDAMLTGKTRMWHAHLSPYINSGLLDPLALCRAVEQRYRDGKVALNGAEGFIRQIIGWREYMRGVYWLAGPDYKDRNFLGATRQLPRLYWTNETDLNCLHQALGQTWATAYAHHIQRLMVTGNFAMLIGADPLGVHLWYMEVYLDAYEWVTLPNTLGMSQFGDGGLVGTKPYAASGAYINRMSDYCAPCRYDPTKRIGEDACPFNALYWDFLDRNREKLGNNPRLGMQYRTWDRFGDGTKDETRMQAASFLARLDAEPAGYEGTHESSTFVGPNEGRKMESLISTEWLSAELGKSDIRVIDATLFLPDAGRDARAEYEAGHIPGAVFLDLAEFGDFPTEAKFASRMQTLGLGDGSRFVVYDNSPLHSAARAWWLLKSFGAHYVALLDGGLAKWKAEGREVESGRVHVRHRHFTAQADDGMLARMADVRNADGIEIVDARSAARFTGEEPEPRPGLAGGHMPGARNLPQGQLFNADGTWKQGDALRSTFSDAGVDLDKPMITTCGSGVTAAVLSFGAHLLGKQDVRLYDGSWAEWGADASTEKVLGAA